MSVVSHDKLFVKTKKARVTDLRHYIHEND